MFETRDLSSEARRHLRFIIRHGSLGHFTPLQHEVEIARKLEQTHLPRHFDRQADEPVGEIAIEYASKAFTAVARQILHALNRRAKLP